MIFKFRNINDDGVYNSTRVMFITGPYSVFNNMVSDRLRDMCKGSLDTGTEDSEILGEFGLQGAQTDKVGNSIDFSTFMSVIKIPAVTGKWFCSVDYKMLTKKQREALEKYMKKPSDNGILVIVMTDYTDYKQFYKNRVIINHATTHLIQLSFPSRKVLSDIVKKLLEDRDVKAIDKAVDLFVMRMSTSYDEYEETLDKICKHRKGETITYKEMVEALKGIENYVIEDFLEYLVRPIKSRKIVLNRKVYKMWGALVEDMGAVELIKKLRYKFNDLIDMRIIINEGIVPIRINFSVPEAKNRLPEDHRLKKMNDFTFRRYAELASRTSLRDWIYMKLIINNVRNTWDTDGSERVLHALIHRSLMSSSRLMNDIGISNILTEQLYDLNSVMLVNKR